MEFVYPDEFIEVPYELFTVFRVTHFQLVKRILNVKHLSGLFTRALERNEMQTGIATFFQRVGECFFIRRHIYQVDVYALEAV